MQLHTRPNQKRVKSKRRIKHNFKNVRLTKNSLAFFFFFGKMGEKRR
nr:hypothetical protein YJCACDKR_YJCACDKR_CDS_0004 [Microvirus sp.]